MPKSVVKDPMELMVSRIRASGRRQGELNQLDAMAEIGGKKTRLVNEKKLAKVREDIDKTKFAYAIKGHEHSQAADAASQDRQTH